MLFVETLRVSRGFYIFSRLAYAVCIMMLHLNRAVMTEWLVILRQPYLLIKANFKFVAAPCSCFIEKPSDSGFSQIH